MAMVAATTQSMTVAHLRLLPMAVGCPMNIQSGPRWQGQLPEGRLFEPAKQTEAAGAVSQPG